MMPVPRRRRHWPVLTALVLLPHAPMTHAQTPLPDPYLWLEDVHGEQALDWVRQRNAESEALLQAQLGYEELRASIREVLDSREQIPHVSRRGAWLYNLWRDAANPRGLWRRTTLAEYRQAEPAWETVIDIDGLGRAEGENWVWAGASTLGLIAATGEARDKGDVGDEADAPCASGIDLAAALPQLPWMQLDNPYPPMEPLEPDQIETISAPHL